MSINLSALMKQRYDTAANWTAQNPTLLAGEIGIESDTKKWKVGTGATAWTSLVYAIGGTYPIVNADIAAGAAIAYSKLATLTSGNIVLGSAANVATSTAVTGDVTISNTGVTAIAAGVIVDADINASAAIVDTKLATIATAGKVSNSATTAASANTASAIVARDASGNFTAGTITAALTGAASSNVLKAGDTMTGVLAVTAGTAALPGIAVSGDTNTGIYSPGADQLAISTGGTVKATVDSSGRLLVGTSSSIGFGEQIQAHNTTGDNIAVGRFSANAGAPDIRLYKSRGSLGTNTAVVADDVLGAIDFRGADGSSYVQAASIRALADGTPGTNDMPGRLVFSTTADGAASPTERMRIHANGSVSIATNSPPSTINFGTFFGRTNLPGLIESFRDINAAGTAAQFGGNLGYAQVMGDGDLENTNNRYTGISDIKFKQNVEDAASQWDDIKAIQVRKYELIANPDRKHIGVIAQELEQTSPGLVIDREDLNGKSYKSVAYSVLYMKAVKALQEAMERIETLETRLSALEAA